MAAAQATHPSMSGCRTGPRNAQPILLPPKAPTSAPSGALTAAAAASLPVPPLSAPLPVCGNQGQHVGCPGVFEARRRWINISRPLKEAPTAEGRLRMLMQLAVGGPVVSDIPKLAELSRLLDIRKAEGLRVDTSGTLDAYTAQPAAGFVSPGVALFDEPQPVPGCAASAAVRVALHCPTKLQRSSMDSNMNNCSMGNGRFSGFWCTSGRQGAKVYVWGESDSLVVGGLLQLLSRSLSGGSPCGAFSLAALGPKRLLRCCSLLDLLPDARIRGFREAAELILRSTCDLLHRCTGCEAALPVEKEHPVFRGVGGRGPAGTLSKPRYAKTESSTAAAATATTAATVRTAPTIATTSIGAGNSSAGCSQEPLGGLSDPSTFPVESTGTHLRQQGEADVLINRSRADLPLGNGVGSEVHVLVSGGVDSAVSLLLMREWGFRPKPVFLKVWAPEATQLEERLYSRKLHGTLSVAAAAAAAAAACPWREDADAAAAVAATAGLSLEVLPMQQPYWDRVITTFLEGARAGLTLNPDWSCNSLVKFGAFVETLGDINCPIVSGHYARIQADEGVRRLLRGRDVIKDQSYFLSGLSLQQLSRSLFPVGALLKTQVRKLAAYWRLPSSQRPDSQGLCFLGPLPVGHFLMNLLGEKEGPIFHFPSGALVGRHKGLWAFTAGQQKGVLPLLDPRLCRRCRGATGGPPTLSGPWSVVGKVPEANALFVVSKEEERAAEDCVRTLAADNRDSQNPHGGPLLEAAAKTDKRALLALKLRQLRTCLKVDNIRWLRGEAPPEFAAPIAVQEMPFCDDGSVAAAVAASAVAAARKGDPVLAGKPTSGTFRTEASKNVGLIVQVRHSAGFHGVAKHKFEILWASKSLSQRLPGGLSQSSSCVSACHEDAELLLEEPDVGLAPGQIAAFYRGDECLGSARISAFQGLPVLKGILGKGN